MIKGYEQDGWVGVSITKVESTTIFKVGGVGACNGQTWLLGLNIGNKIGFSKSKDKITMHKKE